MPRWPITDHLPGNVTVTAYFIGLMAFCYNRRNRCEVGFFGTGKHSLSVEIYQNYEELVFPTKKTDFKGRLELFIKDKLDKPRVKFFHGDDFDTETRVSGDNNDFRWLLDLEAFGSEIPKYNYEVFRSRLFVSHGTFFTFLPTCSKFVDEAFESVPFGHIARVVAVNIQLEKDQSLILKVPRGTQPDPMAAKPGVTYQIVFDNECRDGGKPCGVSDFKEIFSFLKASPFNLKKKGSNGAKPPDNPIPVSKDALARDRSNDATPCMGGGFGESGGFPPE